MKKYKTTIISIFYAVFLAGCGSDAPEPLISELAPGDWTGASGVIIDSKGATAGSITLTESPAGGVLMRVDIEGLSPGWHGTHLHQIGDCSDYKAGFKASGGHINPTGAAHGLLNPDGPDFADLPNIYASADGRATVETYNSNVSLTNPALGYPIIDADGFAFVVHANADDHKTQPIGGAGGRVACAEIKAAQ